MTKRKLNIAIFHLAFIYSGGGERLVLEEARGLSKLGHEVEIFAPVVSEKCFPELLREVRVKAFLPQLAFIVPGHESFLILLTCVLAPLFAWRFRNFDVILAANQPSPWLAWWVKKLFGVPYVSYLAQPTRFLYPRKVDVQTGLIFSKKASESISIKFMQAARRFIFGIDRTSIKNSNLILANGEYMKGVLEKVYKIRAMSCPAGAHPTKGVVNYDSRIKGKINIKRKTITRPYLLITNRHFPQKRFEYAISSLASLLGEFPNLTLVITGEETQYTKQVKGLVKQLSLNGKVNFLGLVNEKSLQKLYQNAAVYLYTAPEEDFGMGTVEAMAYAVPVVTWDAAGPSKIIKNGKTGFLAKPYEIADFANKIKRVLSDRKFAENIGEAAREEVKKKFSYENHIRILEAGLLKEAKSF